MAGLRRKAAPLVAIGASAGGLEALITLLPLLKPGRGVRYLLAQHMSRASHAELVVRVLARHSVIPVEEAVDGTVVLPDVLYVIPAGQDGVFEEGRIHLRPPAEGSHSAPSVNRLLFSVARAAGEDVTAVVLSGAGSDGVLGCREVRRQGGRVWVQEVDSSTIHGMAGAVLNAGLADAALRPEELAERINALVPTIEYKALPQHPYIGSEPVMMLLSRLSERTGIDFTQYRQGTLLRRMDRRRLALGMADMDAYIAYALTNEHELEILHQMFMISWSWFFRDAPAWERLGSEVASLLARKPAGEPFLAWVPGCASGEEAYSIAMLVRGLDAHRPVHIIGSDINEQAVAAARVARYPVTAFRETPPEVLSRFTERESDGSVRISESLRALCTFRIEDALTSLPTEPMDLVSCRNLLIYMKRELQDPLLRNIFSLLRPDGLLFLGMSESLPQSTATSFRLVDTAFRIYRRRAGS